MTPEQRFWAKVDRTDTCWLWTGSRNASTGTNGGGGYGHFSYRGRIVKAHRFAYELLVAPVPADAELDHLCRVRHCVRPDHLEPVSKSVNLTRAVYSVREKDCCKHGHEYTPENTYLYTYTAARAGARQGRACKACRADAATRYQQNRRRA